jgi:hypothetical protein
MRKGTLFLSAVLTTFMLAVMVAGASAYQNLVKSRDTAFQPVEAAAGINAAVPQESAIFTPEQAAALASQVIGRTDLYSVETADLNGASTYLVTFSSGDLVYVSLEGQILSIAKLEQQVVMAPPSGFGGSGNDNTGNDQTVTIRSDHEDEQHEDEHQEDQEDHEDEQEVEHD